MPTRTGSPPPPVAVREPTGVFLDRESGNMLRVVSYNIKWNSVFPDVDANVAPKFARVLAALDPDVIGFQEIGVNPGDRDKPNAVKKNADDVRALLNQLRPLPDGGTWHAAGAFSNVIASKYPVQIAGESPSPSREDRGAAVALVDLPDALFPADLYVINTHHKCCEAEKNDPRRQSQSDAIMSWIRDAREPGGKIQLPERTAIIVLGDLNLVGGPGPLETLVTGNIGDEAKFGPDFAPDWDQTSFTDAHPRHNITGTDDWTWRDDSSPFPPGRLDFVIYSDSVLEVTKSFALNTTLMSDEDLSAAGLHKFDVAKDDEGREFDHLPLVVDFLFAAPEDAGD